MENKIQELSGHLIELKSRILKSLAAICFFSAICYYQTDILLKLITKPLIKISPDKNFIYTGITDLFLININLALICGFALSLPYILWQLYAFLKPGLLNNEKKMLIPFLIAAPILFIIGAAFAYFFILPMAWNFLLSFELKNSLSDTSITFQPRINEYVGIVSSIILAFGLAFQLPLILNILIFCNLINTEFLVNKRRLAIILIFAISAVITPPDAISQIALAIPLILLYELSIITGKKIQALKLSKNGDLQNA